MERKRLLADRFRRIWAIVDYIAREPGKTRKELALKFALSERQIQADLNVIKTDMHLPLVRRDGYRFATCGPEHSLHLTLSDAHALALLLRQAQKVRLLPSGWLAELVRKLPYVFPPHLRLVLQQALDSPEAPAVGLGCELFSLLGEAILREAPVRLRHSQGDGAVHEVVVVPELLFPHMDAWYLVARCDRKGHLALFDVASIHAATLLTEREASHLQPDRYSPSNTATPAIRTSLLEHLLELPHASKRAEADRYT